MRSVTTMSLANLDALIDAKLKEHKEHDAAASVDPADFDWNKRQKEELARPFKNFAEVNKVLDDKAHEDRSAGAYAFMKSCVRRGYTPEETFDLMTKHTDTYIMGHYADADGDVNESRVRADIVRAFIKKTKKRPAPPQEASGIERREVFLHKGKIHEIIDQSEAALIAHGVDIYQRGALVRPSTTETIVAADDRRDTGTRLIPIRRDGMREIFSHYVDFKSYSATEDEWLSADCPKDVGSMYVEREGLWKVRKLAGVINAPTLRPDGTILDKEGYDPD